MQNVRRKDIDSIPSWTYFLSEISSKREANEDFMARWIVDNSEIFNDCACCMLLFGFQLSARKYVQEQSWVSNVMNRMLGTTLHHNTLLCVACWRTKVTKQKTAANRYQINPENVFKRYTGSTNWATQFRFKVSTCQRCSSRHYSPPWSWCTVQKPEDLHRLIQSISQICWWSGAKTHLNSEIHVRRQSEKEHRPPQDPGASGAASAEAAAK